MIQAIASVIGMAALLHSYAQNNSHELCWKRLTWWRITNASSLVNLVRFDVDHAHRISLLYTGILDIQAKLYEHLFSFIVGAKTTSSSSVHIQLKYSGLNWLNWCVFFPFLSYVNPYVHCTLFDYDVHKSQTNTCTPIKSNSLVIPWMFRMLLVRNVVFLFLSFAFTILNLGCITNSWP